MYVNVSVKNTFEEERDEWDREVGKVCGKKGMTGFELLKSYKVLLWV